MVHAAEIREPALELCDQRAADEAGGVQRALENFGKFLFQLDVRCNKIKKRNGFLGVHFWSPGMMGAAVSMDLFTFAGFPTTMALAGTSLVTTLPAPTMAFSPMVTLARIVAPEPIDAPFLTNVRSTFQSLAVFSCPSDLTARG